MITIYTIWLRNMKRYIRSKSRIIGSIAQPMFFFLALGFGLNAAVSGSIASGFNYIHFIIPGIVAMSVLFTSIFTGIQIIWDRQFGFLKETLIAPVSRSSIMLGQTLGGATTGLIQGIIVLIIALIISGLALNISVFFSIIFMLMIGITFTSMGIVIASKMEDMQGFQLIMNFIIMPVFFLSGALFPITTAPEVLKLIAYLNPMTYGVEGIRYSILGSSTINPVVCFMVLFMFSCIFICTGIYFFRKIKI